MDLKAEIDKIVSKVTGDGALKEKFGQDPIGTVKGLVDKAVPDDAVEKIVAAVKGALAGDKLGGIADKLGDLFKK